MSSPWIIPLSVPNVSHILKLVECKLNPTITSYLHHSEDFLRLVNEVLWVLNNL